MTQPDKLKEWSRDPVVITAARTLFQHSLLTEENLRRALPFEHRHVLEIYTWVAVVGGLKPYLDDRDLRDALNRGVDATKTLLHELKGIQARSINPSNVRITPREFSALEALTETAQIALRRALDEVS